MKSPIAVALDAPDLSTLGEWAVATAPHVQTLKIGLEVFLRDGRAAVAPVRDVGCDLFLDLKLHDIPRTVERAVKSAAQHNVRLLTLHACGGRAMLEAAAQAEDAEIVQQSANSQATDDGKAPA